MSGFRNLRSLVPVRKLPALLLALWALFAIPGAHAIGEDEYLQPEEAFQYTATATESGLTVEWRAAKGYYLYKKRFGLAAATPGVTVGEPVYPKGEMHEDEYFGEQEVFRGVFTVTAPLTGAKVGNTVALKLKWQGCADAGLCYPPSEWDATVKVVSATAAATASVGNLLADTSPALAGEDEFLPIDEAFALTSEALSKNTIQLNWRIADGYYLYKERMKVEPTGATTAIGALVLPKGENHYDEYFGNQEVFRQSVDASFSVPPSDATTVEVKVTYQGCADAGLCYPPEMRTVTVSLVDAPAASVADAAAGEAYVSEQDSFMAKLATGSILLVIAIGYLGGLLMSFTPCVLPMVPILSGIIAGGGPGMSAMRGFMLSVSYVAGIAVVYVSMGMIMAYVGAGVNLQAIFNQPAILVPFALLFVVLALAMFGAFTIQMPSFVQSRLSDASNNQRAGTFVGVGVMGALSALIVSACVAPVLIGALTFIAQTGDVSRGAIAMLSISLGMGTPLLLVGASAGALLPKAGAWMETIKNLFGVMFLFVSAWLLSRIVPPWLSMLLWALTAASLAWVMWRARAKSSTSINVMRAIAVAGGIYAVVLVVGGAMGSANPLAPIPSLSEKKTHLAFKRFKTVADLEQEVAAASAAGKAVMVDFYADWCVSCIEMEHKTFTVPDVQAALKDVVLLQADVTANDDEDKKLYRHFDIVGPPTIAFYGADGKERRNFRVVGFMKAAEFAAVVRQAVAPAASNTP
jgi:thiol:disulfide interchange protein DsbD